MVLVGVKAVVGRLVDAQRRGCTALPSVRLVVDNCLPTDSHRMFLRKPRHGGVDGKALCNWRLLRSSASVLMAYHLVEAGFLYQNVTLNCMLCVSSRRLKFNMLFAFSLNLP